MRKHNYVVGYEGEGQCVYGFEKLEYINLLTLFQARKLAKKTVCGCDKSVVYKLVEVKE